MQLLYKIVIPELSEILEKEGYRNYQKDYLI
jgi:hypothetical protein